MPHLNRDAICAVALLLLTGAFFAASFNIRTPDYGTLPPTTWPRVILAYLGLLSAIYLVQSLRQPAPQAGDRQPFNFRQWLNDYRNPLWCYALFAGFLLILPWLGMLIAGIAFVFALLTAIGGAQPRALVAHAAIAVVMVGAMWSLFTYGLGVLLPSGSLFGAF